jgi:hypothetical protein
MFKFLVLCFSLALASPAFAGKKGRNPASDNRGKLEKECAEVACPKISIVCENGKRAVRKPIKGNCCHQECLGESIEKHQGGSPGEAEEHDEDGHNH